LGFVLLHHLYVYPKMFKINLGFVLFHSTSEDESFFKKGHTSSILTLYEVLVMLFWFKWE
jgi:hypothetical protein